MYQLLSRESSVFEISLAGPELWSFLAEGCKGFGRKAPENGGEVAVFNFLPFFGKNVNT